MTDPQPPQPGPSWLKTLGWAAYLACSWTWCIGMFLPVLLVRDYGIWGFVVFAVPNVIGAGAMGWVLRGAGASQRIVTKHRAFLATFSVVTVSFQLCFLFWLIGNIRGGVSNSFSAPAAVFIPLFAGLVFAAISGESRWPQVMASIGSWLLSVSLAVWLVTRGEFRFGLPGQPGLIPANAVWLAPVCTFGFLLCPYLDRTFHEARMKLAGRAGTAAFAFGFGVLFLCMILFTLGYAHVFGGTPILPTFQAATSVAVAIVLGHACSQVMFTTIAHIGAWRKELRERQRIRPTLSLRGVALAIPVAASIFGAPFWMLRSEDLGLARSGLSSFELIYRLFMSFYGLIFPAYVWLCMIPVRGEAQTQQPSRRKLTILFIACSLAAPCCWMGFIERQTIWLVPGLGIVLVARLCVRAQSKTAG